MSADRGSRFGCDNDGTDWMALLLAASETLVQEMGIMHMSMKLSDGSNIVAHWDSRIKVVELRTNAERTILVRDISLFEHAIVHKNGAQASIVHAVSTVGRTSKQIVDELEKPFEPEKPEKKPEKFSAKGLKEEFYERLLTYFPVSYPIPLPEGKRYIMGVDFASGKSISIDYEIIERRFVATDRFGENSRLLDALVKRSRHLLSHWE